jgi:hypothetical protein
MIAIFSSDGLLVQNRVRPTPGKMRAMGFRKNVAGVLIFSLGTVEGFALVQTQADCPERMCAETVPMEFPEFPHVPEGNGNGDYEGGTLAWSGNNNTTATLTSASGTFFLKS